MSESDLLTIFWEEAREHLETLNGHLLHVEMLSPDDAAEEYQTTIKEMNRVAHSLKGAARAVGIQVIETVAHYMEEIFGMVMKGQMVLTPDSADTLYDSLDLIQSIADGETVNDETLALIVAHLEQIIAGVSAQNGNVPPPDVPTPQVASPAEPSLFDSNPRTQEESVRVTVSKLDRLMGQVTELFVSRMHGDDQLDAIDGLRHLLGKWQREWRSVRTAYIRLVRRLQDDESELSTELPILFRFLEYNQRALVDANRQIAALSHNVAQENLRLSSLIDQLQDEVDGMRLIPFEALTGGFQRIVRDLARDTGKQITLEVKGGAVEVDKAVLDALRDPMLHVLRNAVDHGIEPPSLRQGRGKSEVGRITIEVEQRGGEIVITINDDGRGIDADAVRRSAVKNRLLTESEAAALSDEDVRTYVFYSGLSTSEQVTTISGRGLGMDIVRERVESLRGRVSVESVLGQGTSIILNVPVSLTRIRCVVLRVGEQRFAVPSSVVVRMDFVRREDIFTAEGREVFVINDKPTPLVSLGALLDTPVDEQDGDLLRFVLLQATDRAVAFSVDALESEVEMVLKPLGPEIARARFVSGAALMGAGEVVIVLDVNDLVRQATGTVIPVRRQAEASPLVASALRILVVDDSITTRTLEKNILDTAGFDVKTAIDGVEAWEMLTHEPFDVIISDVEMPKMNGLELCQRIKDDPRYTALPVILLTSLAKPEQREAGLRAGADAYLVKSQFDQAELLEVIGSVTG